MQCISPLSIVRPHGAGNHDRITVPCGLCIPCLNTKRAQWQHRLEEQQRSSKNCYFITLTYSDEYLPADSDGQMAVNKYDVQAFLKRLRYYLASGWGKPPEMSQTRYNELKKASTLKYYFVSEYGEKSGRPHYHAIMFDFPAIYSNGDYQRNYVIQILNQSWSDRDNQLGRTSVDSVTPASIGYVLKYTLKRYKIPPDLVKNFALISKGLGKSYIDHSSDYHVSTQRPFVTVADGKKLPMARYYKDKIFLDIEKRKHKRDAEKRSDEINIKERERATKQGDNFAEKQIMSWEQLLRKTNSQLFDNEKL